MPSLSATLSLSASTITVGQTLNCVVTVTNSSGAPINIQNIVPTCNFTGNPQPMDGSSCSFGPIPMSQGFNNVVPASGSTTFQFGASIYQPSTGLFSNDYNQTTGTYTIGCTVFAQDGEVFSPTPQTVTVNPVLPLF